MDLGAGVSGRVEENVACDGRSFCHFSVIVFWSTFSLSMILWQQEQMPFSRTGTVFRLTPFLLLLSFLTLIAPFWTQKKWFLDLLSLSVTSPVPLPYRRDLLRQPQFHHLHQKLHMLHFHAWRLSSDLPDT